MEKISVVRVGDAQWRDLRSVRLAALGESPSAFGSTLARELEYDEARWRSWIQSKAVFLALPAGADAAAGLAAGIPGEDEASRSLVAMWVSPKWRGRGAAARLLDNVAHWARADGGDSLRLWVTEGNTAAERLYERHGYVPTGRVKPLPSNPSLTEHEMVLWLARRAASGGSG